MVRPDYQTYNMWQVHINKFRFFFEIKPLSGKTPKFKRIQSLQFLIVGVGTANWGDFPTQRVFFDADFDFIAVQLENNDEGHPAPAGRALTNDLCGQYFKVKTALILTLTLILTY